MILSKMNKIYKQRAIDRQVVFIYVSLLLLLHIPLYAQERNVGSVEGGMQMGVNTLTDGTWNMGFEIRYNLKKVPVDVGLLTEVDFYNGVFNAVGKFAVVGDYNFKREKNFSQYVGCGVGYGILTRNSCCGSDDKVKCLILSPRAGIELLKFLRLTATLNIPIASHTPKYVSITAGICLGGRRK